MMEHTPGPWTFAHGRILATNDYLTVVAEAYVSYQMIPSNVARANARLMAAAPELLDALESIIAIWESGMPFKDNEIGHARAAIAKATGEAQ